MSTGQDLIDFINSNNWLKNLPIEYTFMELLKRNIIKPSEIIDAHTQVLNDKCGRYKCHYEDSCVEFEGAFNHLPMKLTFSALETDEEYATRTAVERITKENMRKYKIQELKKFLAENPDLKEELLND